MTLTSRNADIDGDAIESSWHSAAADDNTHVSLVEFERGRGARLFAGVMAATLVGCVYVFFAVLSDPIKHDFHMSQEDLGVVTAVAFSLAQFNILGGALFDRFGPRIVNIFALGLVAVGQMGLALILGGYISGTTASVTVAYSLACFGAGFIDIGTLMPNLFAFPLNRSDIVIIQKTFMGLGTSVFSIIFAAAFSNETAQWFCVLTAVFALVVCALVVWLIKPLPAAVMNPLLPVEPNTTAWFTRYQKAPQAVVWTGCTLLGVCMVYLFVVGILYGQKVLTKETAEGARVTIAVIALGFVFAFVSLVWLGGRFAATAKTDVVTAEDELVHKPAVMLQFPTLRAACWSLPFVLLYASLFFQLGAGAVLTSTSAQIYKAANNNTYDSRVSAWFSTATGISSAVGRIGVGGLTKYRPDTMPTAYVCLPAGLMAVGLPLFVWLPDSGDDITSLAAPFVITGVAYGMSWAIAIMVVQRIFNGRFVGVVYSILFTGPLIANAIFNLALFAPHYDAMGRDEHISDNNCAGTRCYATTMYLMAAGNVLSCAAGVAFHWVCSKRLVAISDAVIVV